MEDQRMDEKNIAATPRNRFGRLLRRLVVLAIFVLVAIATLPFLLSTAPVRHRLVKAVNERIQPGRVEIGGLSVSWARGIVLSDVVLLDPSGKRVATAESVAPERGLLGLIASRPAYGVIRVDGATLDVERRADGTIDVMEALGRLAGGTGEPAPGPAGPAGPGMSMDVVVKGMAIKVASPELAEPITAGAFEASATFAPGRPIDASIAVADGPHSLELKAVYDPDARHAGGDDLRLNLAGNDWPFSLRGAGLTAGGRLVGELELGREAGLWSARGDAILRGFAAEGAGLAGDRLVLESLSVGCDVERTAAGWSIRKLDVRCPIAELSATGVIPADDGVPTVLTGHVDLAAASKLLPRAIPLREGIAIQEGRARIRAELSLKGGVDRLQVSADVSDLAATDGARSLNLSDPARLSAALVRTGGVIKVETFAVKAAGVDVTAGGDLASGVKLSGSFDLAAIQAQARELMDLGALDLAGEGRLAADYKIESGAFQGRFAAEVAGLRVSGVTADPVVRDKVRVDGVALGPCDPDGLPTGWDAARLGLKAGDTIAKLTTKPTGEIAIEGSTPITYPAIGVASGRVAMHRTGQYYTLDEVRLHATPSDPQASDAALAVIANGQLNLVAGYLVLKPVGAQPATGVGIGPGGFMLSGIRQADAAMKVDAALFGDMARLDRTLAYWNQSPLRGLGGGWTGRLTASRLADGRLDFNASINAPEFVHATPRGDVALAATGVYSPATDLLELSHGDFTTIHGRVTAAGTIAEASDRRLAAVAGSFEPRWDTIDAIMASSVEPGARIRGAFRPFQLRGPLSGDSASQILRGLEGELAFDVASARAFGMELGTAPVVLRLAGGKAVFDPIATTLNGGTVAINADLLLDDPNALWLRLGRGTTIVDAAINDAVSNDVLSYIAPVLSKASRVGGQVSLTIDDAMIPLTGDGSLRADGQLVFKDVVFQPGPFASEIVALTGRSVPKMSLQQPLRLQIADGRVRQSGLSIPLADDLQANLQGSVGFDKTVEMRASIPITPEMLGGNEAVGRYVSGTNVTLPIGGTISHPVIDRGGLRVALKEAARSMMRRGVEAEAGRLLDRVIPRGPDAAGANSPGDSLRDEALNALEGVGRDLLRPRRR
jgi:translocation and assembly module TamB